MTPSLSQTSPFHGSVGGVAIRRLKQKIKNIEEMVISLDDKIQNMDGEMKENETLREQIRSLEEANKAQGQERKELEKRIKKLEGEKSQLESRLSKQEDKNKQLNDNLKELDAYIQDLLLVNGKVIYKQLVQKDGHIYICGSEDMADGVQQSLMAIFQDFGKHSPEKAQNFIRKMKV
ncbi:hypothetical protein SK128_001682 [Halocaridina rubra]|uniref:NADPH--hemoprotein reductase n=1 Tax=Halocaridina rubra TaxID=373956 RepID=A0AAN8X367_HALRR